MLCDSNAFELKHKEAVSVNLKHPSPQTTTMSTATKNQKATRTNTQRDLFTLGSTVTMQSKNRWNAKQAEASCTSTHGWENCTASWGFYLRVYFLQLESAWHLCLGWNGWVREAKEGVAGEGDYPQTFSLRARQNGRGGRSLCISKSQLIFPVREQWDMDPHPGLCWM